MLIDSEMIKETKKQIEVMQAFIDGKEIELKERFKKNDKYKKANTPNWDFLNFEYRIKPSEPEFVYPIYKRLKNTPEIVVEFHSIDTGIYVSVPKGSIYRPGDIANDIVQDTDSTWEDCDHIELFEVIVYCDIMKEFIIKQVSYSDEELENYKNSNKTGRSFIINKETKQIIKVVNT